MTLTAASNVLASSHAITPLDPVKSSTSCSRRLAQSEEEAGDSLGENVAGGSEVGGGSAGEYGE